MNKLLFPFLLIAIFFALPVYSTTIILDEADLLDASQEDEFSEVTAELDAPKPELIATKLDLSRYEYVAPALIKSIHTPKVIILETPEKISAPTLLIGENGEILPHRVERISAISDRIRGAVAETSSSFGGDARLLIDNNIKNSFSFYPDQEGDKVVTIIFSEPTVLTGIETVLDAEVIMPTYISIRAKVQGKEDFSTVSNRVDFEKIITFPKISASALELSYQTPHLFRVNEIEFIGERETENLSRVIFFAEEDKVYRLFWGAHFGQKSYSPEETHPLLTDDKTPIFSVAGKGINEFFNPDGDGDGIDDIYDLCPQVPDNANADADENGRGDVCEDPDQDGVLSYQDNCPFKYNPGQEDEGADLIGDACDDAENRITEQKTIILWIVFILAGAILGVLVMRSLKGPAAK